MKEQLIKAMQYHQLAELMYISKSGDVTKRRAKVINGLLLLATFSQCCQ